VGCDVCGIGLAQEQVDAHREWHQHREERLEQLIRPVEKLIVELRARLDRFRIATPLES
jgi:hypothetical protein